MVAYGYFCDWFFTQPTFLDSKNKKSWVLGLQNQHFDVGVLGSSRAFNSFDMQMINESKRSAINLGSDGSGFLDNYLLLLLFLDNKNTIDTLWLQVDIASLSSKESFSNSFHIFQFLPYWGNDLVRKRLTDQVSEKDSLLWRLLPSLRYFKYNKYFSPKEVARRMIASKSSSSSFDRTFGGPSLQREDIEDTVKLNQFSSFEKRIDPKDLEHLRLIIEFCKEKNIHLITYNAPEYAHYTNLMFNYKDLHMQIEEELKSHGLFYINNDLIDESNPKYFLDAGHLNATGIRAFTEAFLNHLNNFSSSE